MAVRKFFLGAGSIVVVSLLALFQIKYTVLDLENEHRRLRRQIHSAQEERHVLKAEWTYLNDPERLSQLVQKHLKMGPVRGRQIVKYRDVENSGFGIYDRKGLNALLDQGAEGKKKKAPATKGRGA